MLRLILFEEDLEEFDPFCIAMMATFDPELSTFLPNFRLYKFWVWFELVIFVAKVEVRIIFLETFLTFWLQTTEYKKMKNPTEAFKAMAK